MSYTVKLPGLILSKCVAIAVIILAGISSISYAQVDRNELRDLPPVVFINYEGPHVRLNSREEIRQIGVALGRNIAARERELAPVLEAMTPEQRRSHSYLFETGASNRYFIIHSISAPENSKLNADILGLGVDTGVDHVRNLRVIIQGYLQEAYNYSASDALLLAEYITIYNAVYRGSWDYFLERYKTQVMSRLTRDRTGLSIRYDEWPGRTLIVIPLGPGGLSAIDTAVISDSRVIEEMRREDDQGIPQRQQLVNLMEREAEQAEQQARTEQQAISQEERRIAEERARLEQERQQARENQASGELTQEELERIEEEIIGRGQELAQREETLEQRREEAQRLETFAEERYDDAQQRREEIASDQQRSIVQEAPGGIYAVTIERTDPVTMGRIIRIDPETRRELRRSSLDTVHTRTVTFTGGKLLVIASGDANNPIVRLMELTQSTLERAAYGEDDIQPGSLIWVNGNDLYAITVDRSNNSCFIGRFNTDLALQARSAVSVHPQSSVTVQQGRLLTQRQDGTPLILNPADLTEIR